MSTWASLHSTLLRMRKVYTLNTSYLPSSDVTSLHFTKPLSSFESQLTPCATSLSPFVSVRAFSAEMINWKITYCSYSDSFTQWNNVLKNAVTSHNTPCGSCKNRWFRGCVPLLRRLLQEPHGVISQKMAFFIVTAVKTSNLKWYPNFGEALRYIHGI
jgi:hypothetical protein